MRWKALMIFGIGERDHENVNVLLRMLRGGWRRPLWCLKAGGFHHEEKSVRWFSYPREMEVCRGFVRGNRSGHLCPAETAGLGCWQLYGWCVEKSSWSCASKFSKAQQVSLFVSGSWIHATGLSLAAFLWGECLLYIPSSLTPPVQ